MKESLNKILGAEATADGIISEANFLARKIKDSSEDEMERYRVDSIARAKEQAEKLIKDAHLLSEKKVSATSMQDKERILKQEENCKKNIKKAADQITAQIFDQFGV